MFNATMQSLMLGALNDLTFLYTITPLISHTLMWFSISDRNPIDSSMIKDIEVNPAANQAFVTYNNGSRYLYTSIDTDDMFDLMFDNVESFGKWVNDACKCEGVHCFELV